MADWDVDEEDTGVSEHESEAQLQVRVGRWVGDRYRLEELLRVGTQGAIYRAHDRQTSASVAVKVLYRRDEDPATAKERVAREIRALRSLNHTAAVAVFDQGWTEDGCLALVLELLPGESLDVFLQARAERGEQISPVWLWQYMSPVAETLDEAHRLGICHRDFQPSSVFLCDTAHRGKVRVLDFGFAHVKELPRITNTGAVYGNPPFVAPELWNGQPTSVATDIYAFGAVIYYVLTGEPPFSATNPVVILRKSTRDPRPSLASRRPDLPADVDDWVGYALAIRPEDRFRTMAACWNALCHILGFLK